MEAGLLEDKSPVNGAANGDCTDWVIWQRPERGYVTLGGDLPLIADALEALWSLRAQRRQIDTFLAARGWILAPGSPEYPAELEASARAGCPVCPVCPGRSARRRYRSAECP